MIRRSLSLVALMIVAQFALLLSPMAQLTASAASEHPEDQLERWLYYRGMRACFDNPDFDTRVGGLTDNNKVTAEKMNEGGIFTGLYDGRGLGYLGAGLDDGNDGIVSCSQNEIFTNGAKIFGFSNVVELICEMNRALSSEDDGRIRPSDAADCERSQSFELDGGGDDVFQRALTDALEAGGTKDRPPFNINDNNGDTYTYKSLLYLIGSKSLSIFCGNNVSLEEGIGGDIGNKDVVSVDVVKSDGTVLSSQPYALGNDERDEDSSVKGVYYNQGSTNAAQELRCHQMAKMTRDNSADFAKWQAENQEVDPGGNIEGGEGGEEAVYETTCAIDGVGWIVCPVMIFVGKMNDAAFGFLEEILGIRPAVVTSESTQAAWAAFRDIANVAFVIAFMVIVYSQITSAGISNYGIKKMLPRIVIAAILVNVSFILCAIAVDLSNIVGASVYSLFQNSIAPDVGSDVTNASWEEQIAGALALATAIGVILIVVLFFIGPMALLALGMIILILIARQALVILLIVVAPLAFVAYLLPNTEDWFKKWYKAFIAVLMVYPIVGAVFGVSTLASRVLSSVAADTEDSSLLQIIALGVLAVPLFAVPAILKSSLSAAGSIGARISNLADKTQGKATSRGMKRLGDAAGDAKNRWNLAAANGKLGTGALTPGGLTRRGMRRDFLRSSRDAEAKRATGAYTTELLHGDDDEARKYQRAAGGGVAGDPAASVRAAARATQQQHKQYDEDVSAHKTMMTGLDHAQLMKIMKDKNESSERRAAAAGTIMSRDYRAGHLEALQAAGEIGRAGDDKNIGDIQKQMAHDMSDKPFALGDQAAGQLKIGTYGQVQPEVTNADGTTYQPPQLGDLNAELRQRVEEKLSPASLAKMNPDEMTRIYEMSQKSEADGGLTAAQKRNLVKAIEEARADDQYKGLIKPNEQKKHDKILQDAAASSYGPNI